MTSSVASTLVTNVGELTTNDPTLGDGSAQGRLTAAAFAVEGGRVAWVGPADAAPACDTRLDVDGAAVVPGFVDAHTHLVFAGERSDEFEARLAGRPYDGGGIARTVAATRAASTAQLRHGVAARVRALRAGGVTTLEVKSGYELTSEGEARDLRLAREVTEQVTWLGAHALPPEFAHDRAGYLALLTGEMLARCAPLARWADVFCDVGAFDLDETRVVLEAARARGLGLRVHANQLAHGGAVRLAVELGAASADHLTHLDDDDVEALAGSSTVATLLPGAEFCTRSDYAPARRLLDAGATVALSTDCNPGTSYVTSMALVIALAVREMGLTCDEALWAATRGGARALHLDDVGHLGVGARADFLVLDAPRAAHLAYRPGADLVTTHVATIPDAPDAPDARRADAPAHPVGTAQASRGATLAVCDLVVSYGDHVAVDGIDLSIAPGEILGLLGPNGAGKTSTLSAIEGLVRPRRGRVTVDGIDALAHPSAARARLGVQLQANSFSPELTLAQIVRLFGGLYGVRLSAEEAVGRLGEVGLGEEAGRGWKHLSGGQQQRLSLVVAMVHRPSLLLLDEPTAGLDPQARRQLWGRIDRVRATGAGVLLT
ncbi:MAG: imidazolonepropionase, partial [Acidimicrobiales bacterium]